jgi:hypothetical protein
MQVNANRVGESVDGYLGIRGWGSMTAAVVFSRYPRLEDIPKDWRHWNRWYGERVPFDIRSSASPRQIVNGGEHYS